MMEEENSFCAICGCPTEAKVIQDAQDNPIYPRIVAFLEDIRIISASVPYWTRRNTGIHRDDQISIYKVIAQTYKVIAQISPRKYAIETADGSQQTIEVYDDDPDTSGGVCTFFPIHQACLQVALQYLDTAATEKWALPKGKRLAAFYHGLEHHYREISNHYFRTQCMLWDGNGCLNDLVPDGTWWGNLAESTPFVLSPLDIPDLTPYLLSRLQPFEPSSIPDSSHDQSLSKRVSNLAPELSQAIFDELHPLSDLSMDCTRLLAPHLWREVLLSGSAFAWLWDIDPEACREKDEQGPGKWDWELLVRTLAQRQAFEPGQLLQHAPHELRNRRRIWGILEEVLKTAEGEEGLFPVGKTS